MNEVIARIAPGTLTIAIVMDSMDWFDRDTLDAETQVRALYKVLKRGGRVLLRSAGLEPWYVKTFRENGFQTTCVGRRTPGSCIDRVNMYASCWICTKARPESPILTRAPSRLSRSNTLENISLGEAAMDEDEHFDDAPSRRPTW